MKSRLSLAWPRDTEFAARFKVQDLIPVCAPFQVRAVFIGESPHRDEVAPESENERSPFRGVAGRDWWSALAKYMKSPEVMRPVPSRSILQKVCDELGVAVMNAVQYPIDEKIMLHQGKDSSPEVQLGFKKGTGASSYKAVLKQKGELNPVESAIQNLYQRLRHFEKASVPIVCLGNDSKWFVEKAIEKFPEDAWIRKLPIQVIPHPSSWWRNVAYKEKALQSIDELLRPDTSFLFQNRKRRAEARTAR